MEYYIYLSLIPESLVVSMLPAQEFGKYLAIGTKKRPSEQAIYFELSKKLESDYFDLQGAIQSCKPHEDGQPKPSVYVSTYRVLEHVPLDVIGSLWLVTSNGLALELKKGTLNSQMMSIFLPYPNWRISCKTRGLSDIHSKNSYNSVNRSGR